MSDYEHTRAMLIAHARRTSAQLAREEDAEATRLLSMTGTRGRPSPAQLLSGEMALAIGERHRAWAAALTAEDGPGPHGDDLAATVMTLWAGTGLARVSVHVHPLTGINLVAARDGEVIHDSGGWHGIAVLPYGPIVHILPPVGASAATDWYDLVDVLQLTATTGLAARVHVPERTVAASGPHTPDTPYTSLYATARARGTSRAGASAYAAELLAEHAPARDVRAARAQRDTSRRGPRTRP